MSYHGDIRLEDTIDIKRTFVDATGLPVTVGGTLTVVAYPGNDTDEITAGITATEDFDSRTGLANIRVEATAANGYLTNTNYALVVTVGTAGGVSIVGYEIGSFSIEHRSALRAVVANREITVDANLRVDLGLWLGVAPNAINNGAVEADVQRWLDVAPLALVAQRVQTSVGAMQANVLNAAAINAAALTLVKFGAGAINATVLAADAIGASQLATDAAEEIRDAILSDSMPFAGANIDATISSRSSHTAAQVRALTTGTADAGSTASILRDAARTESVVDYWQHAVVLMTSGPNVGQMRRIRSFAPATDDIIVTPAFKTAIGIGDTYEILATCIADGLKPIVEGNEQTDVAAGGDVGADVQTWLTTIPSILIAGRVDASVGAMAANVLTAAAINANAITAAKIAAAAITVTQAPNLDAAITTRSSHSAADVWGVVTRTLTASLDPTLTAIVDGILDEAIAGHIGAGTVGNLIERLDLIATGGAGELTAARAALLSNLDATVASRATPAQVNTEMVDALSVDTYAEPGQILPPATNSIVSKLSFLYKAWRNEKNNDGAITNLLNDAGGTVDQKQTTSEAGGTVTKGEWASGP